MLETLKQLDTEAFVWINSHHNPIADWVLWTLSQHWSWAIVLGLVFGLATMRQEPRRWWLVALAVGLCFLIADQGSVHLFKEQFHRLRPCHALDDVRMFHTRCGGLYGFVSSHAANALAIATFLCLRYRKKAWVVITLSIWALLTCYSRAYLGKHYPGDLLCGGLFGAVTGIVVFTLTTIIEKKSQSSGTK